MPETQFKVGDVVALNSGGPAMTVARIVDDGVVNFVDVCWFAGDELKRDAFAPAVLLNAADFSPADAAIGAEIDDLLDEYRPKPAEAN